MQYEMKDGMIVSVEDGERKVLCNFEARITKETRIVDGQTTETKLTLEGKRQQLDQLGKCEEITLPPTEVSAANFPGMGWVMSAWGTRCVMSPGGRTKEDIRAAIQLNSTPEVKTIYKHTGWAEVDGKPTYLHAGGGIGEKGNNPDITVQLPTELSKYDLTQPGGVKTAECVKATIKLLDAGPIEATWTLLAATIAPLFGPVDFAVHVTGRTGTFKSELLSLFQSHYGSGMDARHLPGSWSSTPNALEAQAYLAKNAAFVVDDFIPTGTSWQQRSYQATADKLVRGQGNQSGRARLTDMSNLQTAMYPRGIVLSSGEDTPEGHSVRARMMILELAPGDVKADKLTAAQQNRSLYPGTVAGIAQYIAKNGANVRNRMEALRAENRDLGHTRTPSMYGYLVAVAEWFCEYAELVKAVSHAQATKLSKEAEAAIRLASEGQNRYLESADPVELFLATLRGVLVAGSGHVRTLNGGIPRNATALGWNSEQAPGELPTYKARGHCVGWINWNRGELYVDITGGYNVIKRAAGADLSLSKQTMLKRLRDAGVLSRVDEARQRNTVRVTAENHPRQVLALRITEALDNLEVPDDGSEQATA